MDNESIITEIVRILNTDTTLSGYVQKVFMGDRKRIYTGSYPCIVVDTSRNPLERHKRGSIAEYSTQVDIYPATLIKDREKALIGTDDIKGILDMVEDIKTALNANYPDLNRNCLNFELTPASIDDFEDFTGKFAQVSVMALYREAI